MSKKANDPWVRIINVSDPLLHEKGYTLYKVTSKVFPRNSVEAVTQVTVWKRYNDFKKLHKALSTIHQNLHLKGIFPPFAKARFFGRFHESVIEERRQSALQLLQFAANYPPLFTSQVFVKFFEDSHVVENCKQPAEPQSKIVDGILQPSYQRQSDIIHSTSADKNSSNELRESANFLGGTWKHHQVPDNISLGSQCTDDDDEDDRTTFTDDDSTVSRPSLNLAEFDPLFESNNISSEFENILPSQERICNNWLLSALQSCSNPSVEKDVESLLEFPTPFSDAECADDITPSSEYKTFNSNSDSIGDENISFDLPTSINNGDNCIAEFDPLANKVTYLPDSDDDFYNCDEFAMTPNSFKKELQRRPSFIIHASKYVVNAQEAEESGNYHEAFESYKKAIDVLLQGIQHDKCSDFKDAVRKKVLLYLMRAEEIYENKLPKVADIERVKIHSSYVVSPIDKVSTLQGCVQDLNKYKVLGVLGSVLLVLDITTSSTYIVKALYKSSAPKTYDMPHVVPQNIPFMVKLIQIYETSYAIFLLLEHATGGRLWDYVSSFLQRSPLSPCNDGTCLYVEYRNKTELCNVYSGKKISEESTNQNPYFNSSVDSDLIPAKNCPSSYVALFKRYVSSVNEEGNVGLAKFNRFSNVPYYDKKSNTASESILCSSIECGKASSTVIVKVCDDEKEFASQNSKCQSQQHKSTRNRLSSSTGSLESAISQKICLLEAFNAMDEVVFNAVNKPTHLPESCIYLWAAEIVVALESLHKLGVIWRDFHWDNILLGAEGHILLTYQSQWSSVDHVIKEKAKENLFCAPEVGGVFPVTFDCDWWSLGVILFELLTGRSLVSCHPTGITRHTVLNFPSDVSSDARDFISKLLQHNSSERLGSGVYGVEEIKSHPFFRLVDWESLYQS